MKAGYKKPTIEFEDFELNAVIAAGCTSIVNLGPGDATHTTCSDYKDYEGLDSFKPGVGILEVSENFYEGSCSCYLSAGGGALFTS